VSSIRTALLRKHQRLSRYGAGWGINRGYAAMGVDAVRSPERSISKRSGARRLRQRLAIDLGVAVDFRVARRMSRTTPSDDTGVDLDDARIGKLEGKQVASLAGLAPISRQSGKWQGKERIQGGRAFLRRAIYMPALVATRYNPDLKAKYDQLIRAGKPAKVAINAIMRKLIVTANALLRDGRKWSEVRP
jgi:Transposase IS116/IS110/IS902 family